MRLKKVLCAAVLGALLIPTAAGASSVTKPEFVHAIKKLDAGFQATVLPLHAPMPATSTGIGPGSQIMMTRPDGAFICTANFIWTKTDITYPTRPNGKPMWKATPIVTKTKYLGAAGHCFLSAEATSTHGYDADYDPADTEVSVCVTNCEFGDQVGPFYGTFVELGKVAHARQTKRGIDPGNDFGIVEIPKDLWGEIRPGVPVWEGPSSVQDVTVGGNVCVYGNGTVVGAAFPTKARAGIGRGLDPTNRYWIADLPSAQGDSGSALVTCEQDEGGLHGTGAAGALTHISPINGAIIGTTTSRAVEMVKEDTGVAIQLVLEDGTEVTPPALAPLPQPDVIEPGTGETVHPVQAGDPATTWTAGPFNRQAPDEAIAFGESCSGVEPASEYCDYEFVDLDVPENGANFTTTISTEDTAGDDFDLFVFDPHGYLVDSAATGGTPPETVTAFVKEPGVYTIAVDPYGVTDASYSGEVKLEVPPPPPPPPPVPFDGEISMDGSYSWQGTTPLPSSLVFTCAEPVNLLFCDDEFIKVNVPDDGATLVLDVGADVEGDDFDACLYDPDGAQTCTNEGGNEHFTLVVEDAGVYRVGVQAFLALGGGYTATITLAPPPAA